MNTKNRLNFAILLAFAAVRAAANEPPVVANPIPDQSRTYGSDFNYTFPADSFSDPDVGDMLAYTASGFPAGVAFDGPSRSFSGVPTTSGTFIITVTATDDGMPPLSTDDVFELSVPCPAIILAPTSLTAATRDVAYSRTLTASGGSSPYTFAVTSGTLPAGLSLSGEGLLSGTPTFGGSSTFTVRATDAGGCTGSRSYTLSVTCPAIAVSPSSLPNGTRNTPYTQTITASGGTAPYTFAVTSGALPPGISLVGNGLLASALTTARFSHTATLLQNGKVLVAGGQGPGGFAVTAELYDPAAGTWKTTGALIAGRTAHTATLLPNGKVLVAGGSASTGTTNSAELYDPATGTWTATGDMGARRATHTATLLPNGQVLVAGGNGVGGTLTSAELYDPATGNWTATGPMNIARSSHTATLLLNGKVLVTKGNDNSAELYDPTAGSWTPTGSHSFGGGGPHTATLLQDGRVLVAGGFSGPVAEIYDPSAGTWAMTGFLNAARAYHTANLLANGKVLVTGGVGINFMGQQSVVQTAELFDPATGTWTPTGSGIGRVFHTATLLANGKVLVTAGQTGVFGSGTTSSSELYDSATGAWSATGVPTSAGSFPFTVTATDAAGCSGSRSLTLTIVCSPFTISPGTLPEVTAGNPYSQTLTGNRGEGSYSFAVTGGALPTGITLGASGNLSGTPVLPGIYSFTVTATDGGHCTSSTNFTLGVGTASPMNTQRGYHTSTLLPNGKLLVVGGCCGNNGSIEATELYDPAAGRWTVAVPPNTTRYSHTATLLPNGKVLVVGGASGNPAVAQASAELYDPAAGTWTLTGTLNTARGGHTATLLPNGKVLVAGGGNLASAELYDPATGTWTATGTLNTARYGHTATLLPNGKVLVAGGFLENPVRSLNSAELFDPATGTWTATGSLITPRSFHAATLLPNGKVLIVAGNNYNFNYPFGYQASAEIYDPATGAWTVTGALTTAREDARTTLLPNGKVLIVGGYNDNLFPNAYPASAELYDPTPGTWTVTSSLINGRVNHTATLLPNGKVLIAGGFNVAAGYLTSVELYDSAVGAWAATGGLTTGRSSHTATLLPNGKVLAAGGSNSASAALTIVQIFDPAAGTWTAANPMGTARSRHTASLLPDGKVLVAGGGAGASVFASTELYDPATGTWAASGSLSDARWFHTATLLPSGKVMVAGGRSSAGAINGAELYDTASGAWTATSPLSGARWNHTATLLPNGKVLVTGGTANGTTPLSTAELYDPATGVWTGTAGLNIARMTHAATLLPNGKVLVSGGFSSSAALATTELYNPAAGTWTAGVNMAVARRVHTATLLPNGKLMVTGGTGTAGTPSTSAELYDPATGTWKATSALLAARGSHTATLLPNGKILVAAGQGTSSYLSSADLYDVGLGFSASWQPQIATLTSPLVLGGSLALTGSRFRGISEGSYGNTQDSPADYPVVQLRSLENAQTLFPLPANWSPTSFGSAPVSGLPPGWTLVTVFVNGIPSTSSLLRVDAVVVPTVIVLTNPLVLPNGSFQFAFPNTSGATFTALATTDLTMPMSSWSVLGPVTEVSPGQFQFTDPQAATGAQRFYAVRSP